MSSATLHQAPTTEISVAPGAQEEVEDQIFQFLLGRSSSSASDLTTRDVAPSTAVSDASPSRPDLTFNSSPIGSTSSEPTTPLLSESEISDSPSVGSVRMAAIVHGGPALAGRNHEYVKAISTTINSAQRKRISSARQPSPTKYRSGRQMKGSTDEQDVEIVTLARRNVNPRRLSVKPVVPPRISSTVATSVQLAPLVGQESSVEANLLSSSDDQPANSPPSQSQPERRKTSLESLESVRSYEEEDSKLLSQPSIQRMSFLGPKMKHISPAPWQIENESDRPESRKGTLERSLGVSEGNEGREDQQPILSPRNRLFKDAWAASPSMPASSGETTPTTIKPESIMLKGLGLAISSHPNQTSTSTQSPISAESTGPVMTKASRLVRKGGGQKTASPSLSPTLQVSSPASLPPPTPRLLSTSPTKNINRESYLMPQSAPYSRTTFSHAIHSPSQSATSNASMETVTQIHNTSSSPHKVRRNSLPTGQTPRPHLRARSENDKCDGKLVHHPRGQVQLDQAPLQQNTYKTANHPRKNAVLSRRSSSGSLTTLSTSTTHQTSDTSYSSSTSGTSLSGPNSDSAHSPSKAIGAPGKGMRLISLDDARERQTPHVVFSASPMPAQTQAARAIPSVHFALPPSTQLPPNKLKNKRSGFLKLFKGSKEDNLTSPASDPVGASSGRSCSPSASTKDSALKFSEKSLPTHLKGNQNYLHPPQGDSGAPRGRQSLEANVRDVRREHRSMKRANTPPCLPIVSLEAPSPDPNKQDFSSFGAAPCIGGKQSPSTSSTSSAPPPSLSLRPVSMMFTSMPQAFLSKGDDSGAAKASEVPTHITFEGAVTPPARSSPIAMAAASQTTGNSTFGLPTPPDSASSARTFSRPPSPMLNVTESDYEATLAAGYRARIVELEAQVRTLQKRLDAFQEDSPTISRPSTPSIAAFAVSSTADKACQACGCSCRSASPSILERPRIVGHGNMFSSNHD